jgi:rod shape-determining protein MreD
MKKILIILSILIAYVVIYFVQANFFSWFTIAGIKPNLFIIFILFIGLFMGEIYGVVFGAIFGTVLDLFTSQIIGISGITLMITGFLAGILNKNFSKESKLTIMIIVMSLTFLCEVISYLLQLIMLQVQPEIMIFVRIVLIEMLYNVLIVIIIYPIFQNYGSTVERIMTEKKILTKYY